MQTIHRPQLKQQHQPGHQAVWAADEGQGQASADLERHFLHLLCGQYDALADLHTA